jgi:hypothetical protein
MNAGPISHAVAWIPATTTTTAAAPTRMIRARGRPPREIPFSGVGGAAGADGTGRGAGMSDAGVVTELR